MKSTTIKFFKEYAALFAALVLFLASPYIIRIFYPTAGAYDPGVLQLQAITIFTYAVYQAITWSITKGIWPAIGKYMKSGFNNDFLNLEPWQKIKVSLFVFFSILALLVLLSKGLMPPQ